MDHVMMMGTRVPLVAGRRYRMLRTAAQADHPFHYLVLVERGDVHRSESVVHVCGPTLYDDAQRQVQEFNRVERDRSARTG